MFGKLVDMALSVKKDESAYPSAVSDGPQPIYPWGLSVSLEDEQLDRLDLEVPEIGDLLDSRIMLRVNSVSQNETTTGKRTRVECQIVMMGVESEEDEVVTPKRKLRNFYNSK